MSNLKLGNRDNKPNMPPACDNVTTVLAMFSSFSFSRFCFNFSWVMYSEYIFSCSFSHGQNPQWIDELAVVVANNNNRTKSRDVLAQCK
jgi:hypothetical protein